MTKKIVEAVWPKKHGFLGSQASKCSQISSARNGGNVYRFESDLPRYVARYDCSLRFFSSLLRAIFQRLAVTHVTRSQVQAHANLGHVFDAEDEPCPETRCNQWTSMQDLTDMAMALLCQYQQCNFSPPMRLQFLWSDGREILALKASFRIRLVMVWNHVESACNESASNSQKLEQGAHLGQLCRYKRERTKTGRSSRWSLCRKVCIYLKEARREIKRLLVKRATVRVSTCVRHSCMHLQGALRPSNWSIWRKCADQFHMVQDIALISARCRNAAGWTHEAVLETSGLQVYKHIQTVSHRHQIGSVQFARCRSAFPDDRLLAWRSGSEVKMSSHNHSRPSNSLINVSC